ncbi:restriction endonuclease [Crocinitomix catalasitica]|uniref:restriction endonuclease n=1 Tax=Crocinitomix catalasitica TaxID=184607 RepID=UPI000685D6C9|nr:restriction endonuclease [Crocinitomix catalasitica]
MNENTKYEKFAQEIYQEFLSEDGITTEIKHDVKLQGKSTKHQIDVYWEYTFAGVNHKVAIECKNYSRKISVGIVRDFYGVLSDIGNINGVIVTTVGYQKGAKDYAEHHGINLKVLRIPKPEDWKGRIKSIQTNVSIITHEAKEYFVQLDLNWCKGNLTQNQMDSIDVKLSGLNNQMWIYDENNKPFKNFLQLQDELPVDNKKLNDNSHFYKYDNMFVKSENCGFIKIIGVNVKFNTSICSQRWVLDAEHTTKAILKDVLTGEMKFIK